MFAGLFIGIRLIIHAVSFAASHTSKATIAVAARIA
jgi:hypothetical protein